MTIWMATIYLFALIGLVITTMTLIDLRKITKELKACKEDEELPKKLQERMMKNTNMGLVGVSLTSITGIVSAIFR